MNRSPATTPKVVELKPQVDALHFLAKSRRGWNISIHRSKPAYFRISSSSKFVNTSAFAKKPDLRRRIGLSRGQLKPSLYGQMTRRLHLLGRGNANESEHQGYVARTASQSGQTGTPKARGRRDGRARQHLAGSVEAVEARRRTPRQSESDETERGRERRAGDEVGELVELTRKGELGRVGQ